MTTPFLLNDLKHDEGCELKAYKDTKGIWTIGVGHAHVSEGMVWTQAHCDAQLAQDIARAEAELDANAAWWRDLEDTRQDVMAMLCFNMGWGDGEHGLSSFKNTLAEIRKSNFAAAAHGLATSKWAAEVKAARAGRLAAQMQTGVRIAPA
jgi:lysozyme